MEEFGLRRTLSDELHARAFRDFEGAGRFIRYVFLTDGDTGAILDYVNAFLDAAGRAPIPADNKFLRLDMDGYALRGEDLEADGAGSFRVVGEALNIDPEDSA